MAWSNVPLFAAFQARIQLLSFQNDMDIAATMARLPPDSGKNGGKKERTEERRSRGAGHGKGVTTEVAPVSPQLRGRGAGYGRAVYGPADEAVGGEDMAHVGSSRGFVVPLLFF